MSTTVAATSAQALAPDQPRAARKPAPQASEQAATDAQARPGARAKADAAAYSEALRTLPGGQVADGVKAYAPESLGGSLLSRSI